MPSFKLLEFQRRVKNSLVGFVSGRLDCGDGLVLELVDLAVHRRDGKSWIGWPAKPLIDRDGQVMRHENGKVRYSAPLVPPADREVAARIEAAILEQIAVRLGQHKTVKLRYFSRAARPGRPAIYSRGGAPRAPGRAWRRGRGRCLTTPGIAPTRAET